MTRAVFAIATGPVEAKVRLLRAEILECSGGVTLLEVSLGEVCDDEGWRNLIVDEVTDVVLA
jgi:hypothetical protein